MIGAGVMLMDVVTHAAQDSEAHRLTDLRTGYRLPGAGVPGCRGPGCRGAGVPAGCQGAGVPGCRQRSGCRLPGCRLMLPAGGAGAGRGGAGRAKMWWMRRMLEPVDDAIPALARSGLLALTGQPDEAPVLPPLGVPAYLAGLAREIKVRTRSRWRPIRVSWEAAISGRAAMLGWHRQGQISANGSCRLLRTADGWVAVNLPRPDDIELVPALIGKAVTDPWIDLAAAAALARSGDLVSRARLLGMAVSPIGSSGRAPLPWTATPRWPRAPRRTRSTWRVVDLSSLWAGPIVGRILAEAGAEVVKVESSSRPDAARDEPAFYQWLHAAGEVSVQFDFRSPEGRAQVAALLDEADVVIEASRPRALEQLSLGPDDRPGRPGRVWLSITGHGRSEPGRDWAAFGDDAAVAGGLVGRDDNGTPVFCGDAIADPISGLAGAVAVLRALDEGGGQLIDLAMSRAAAIAASYPPGPAGQRPGGWAVEAAGPGRWQVRAGELTEAVRDGPPGLEWVGPAG